MTFPTEVELDVADQKAMRKINDKNIAVQHFMATIQQQSETRLRQLQEDTRALFAEFSKKYKIDLAKVDYVPSDDGTKLVPVRIKLNG